MEEEPSTPHTGPLNLAIIKKSFKSDRYTTPKKSKNLKQILALEKTQDLAIDVPTCKFFPDPHEHRPLAYELVRSKHRSAAFCITTKEILRHHWITGKVYRSENRIEISQCRDLSVYPYTERPERSSLFSIEKCCRGAKVISLLWILLAGAVTAQHPLPLHADLFG